MEQTLLECSGFKEIPVQALHTEISYNKTSQICYTIYVPRRLFFKIISSSSGVTLSQQLFAPTLKRVVGYAQDIQCTLGLFMIG